jgi:hypothetical protein
MATSSVGVTKKRVRVIDNASSTYSAEYEQDVYVVDTTDATLQLQTGTESGVDLTGNTEISTDSGVTATIGSNTSSNYTSILSRNVNIGDSTGNRNIYIGNQNETNSSVISIGSTLADVTIGQPDSVNGISGSTKLQNKTIQIGKVQATSTPSNSGSNVYIESDLLSVTSKSTHTSRAVGTLKLVGSNDTLGDTGARSQLLLGTSSTQNSYSSDGSDTGAIGLSPTSVTTSLTTTDSTASRTLYSSSVSRDLATYGTHNYYWANQSLYTAGSALNTVNNTEYTITNRVAAGIDLVGNPYSTNEPSIYLRSSPNHHIELHAGSYQLNDAASASPQGSKVNLRDSQASILVNDSSFTRGRIELTTNALHMELRDYQDAILATGGYNSLTSYKFYSTTGFNALTGGYSPFTGVHIFDIMENETIEVGDAVELVNKQARRAASSMSKICVGLAISINNNKVEVAAVGDTECGDLKGFKVCDENGSITAGDLLVTSSRPGYLMKQSDDIIRSTTVGKSAVDVQFDQSGLATDIYGFIYCG